MFPPLQSGIRRARQSAMQRAVSGFFQMVSQLAARGANFPRPSPLESYGSVQDAGALLAPLAGVSIAKIVPGRGTWWLYAAIQTSATDFDNMQMVMDDLSFKIAIPHPPGAATVTQYGPFKRMFNGSNVLSITPINNGTAGVTYRAQIIAYREDDPKFSREAPTF
jgi:hypothetical protein